MTATRPPRLGFHGAARAVTGSCFRLQTDGGDILIDCGMFQGSKTEKELNYRPFPFEPSEITAVILTHAHIDHCGLLPKLMREGFRGPVFATGPAVDLCQPSCYRTAPTFRSSKSISSTAAPNSAALAGSRAIYDDHDVKKPLRPCAASRIGDWLQARRAHGHALERGTSCWARPRSRWNSIRRATSPCGLLFSGDIGPDHKLLHADPEGPSGVDYVICESTYGDTDRIDKSADERRTRLRDEVQGAMRPGGALIIPSFAVERAQELVADLGRLMADGDLPTIPVYVDSPLATRATEVFARHRKELRTATG